MTLDPRLHACRPDLADERLRGQVKAARFAAPVERRVAAPIAPVLEQPSAAARQATQALGGEPVMLFEERNGWCWVQLSRDGYVGYMASADLDAAPAETTHRISVPLALSFPAADIKSRPASALPLGAEVAAREHDARFLAMADGRFLCRAHAQPLSFAASDFVAVAGLFLGVPYLWGGKSFMGLDCSGLVQLSLEAAGHSCPRDADMQESDLGIALPPPQHDALQRGDLVFWKGHVGIMEDSETLLHANGHHMQVVREPVSEAIARIAASGSPVTSIKRL